MTKYNVLIVDDRYDNQKSVIAALLKIGSIEYKYVISIRDALTELHETQYDLMLIDIQIPDFSSGDILEDGGVYLIDQISLIQEIHTPFHIIGITSHRESFDKHNQYFIDSGWPLLHNKNIDQMELIFEKKLKHTPVKQLVVDVAIITALRNVELESILNLPIQWETLETEDSNIYYIGEYSNKKNQTKRILATSCSRMGVASAASLTMKVCEKFSPSLLIMTGIAAGIQGKTKIGDILVADPCWDWGSGKITIQNGEQRFLSSPHQLHIEPKYRNFFQNISASRTYLDEIYQQWSTGAKPTHSINLHIGPVATGSVVLEDPDTVKSIKDQHRELVGVEMEGYGLLSAAHYASNPVKALVIKSVCDFADPDKHDDWQCYAAYTSAQLAYRFLTEGPM